MNEKPWRVIAPHNRPWASRFVTEDAAWNRLLALKRKPKTPRQRGKLLGEGWKIEKVEPRP